MPNGLFSPLVFGVDTLKADACKLGRVDGLDWTIRCPAPFRLARPGGGSGARAGGPVLYESLASTESLFFAVCNASIRCASVAAESSGTKNADDRARATRKASHSESASGNSRARAMSPVNRRYMALGIDSHTSATASDIHASAWRFAMKSRRKAGAVRAVSRCNPYPPLGPSYPPARNGTTSPAGGVSQKRAQSAISRRRLSNRSPRR